MATTIPSRTRSSRCAVSRVRPLVVRRVPPGRPVDGPKGGPRGGWQVGGLVEPPSRPPRLARRGDGRGGGLGADLVGPPPPGPAARRCSLVVLRQSSARGPVALVLLPLGGAATGLRTRPGRSRLTSHSGRCAGDPTSAKHFQVSSMRRRKPCRPAQCFLRRSEHLAGRCGSASSLQAFGGRTHPECPFLLLRPSRRPHRWAVQDPTSRRPRCSTTPHMSPLRSAIPIRRKVHYETLVQPLPLYRLGWGGIPTHSTTITPVLVSV